MPVANPKLRGRAGPTGRAHWYPYYAGYSTNFVDTLLDQLALGSDAVVLDPWNGSGTTTTVCSLRGVRSKGFDINPAMVTVARARQLDSSTAPSLAPMLSNVLSNARQLSAPSPTHDPLSAWFTAGTVTRLRRIEQATYSFFVDQDTSIPAYQLATNFSSIAAFFYVLLFRTCRRLLKRAATSNPTWMKAKLSEATKVRADFALLDIVFAEELAAINLLDRTEENSHLGARSTIAVADSRDLPQADASVDAVITSPPYCTRIDYAVATRIELAVLGVDGTSGFDTLRRAMLGTTIAGERSGTTPVAGAAALLERIAAHPSKASASYYLATYRDYFEKFDASLVQVARVVKPGGSATFVVQDSLYKDIHIDLAQITTDRMAELGFDLDERHDFACVQTMRHVHTASRRYNAAWRPTETVLQFKKD